MIPSRRNTAAAIGLFVILAQALVSCGTSKSEENAPEKFPVVQISLKDTFYYNEYVSEISAIQNIEIRSRIKGHLDKILVDEGAFVRRGQVLFQINSQEYTQQLLQANAKVKNAYAELKTAEVERNNIKMLADKKVISATELELAEAKVDGLKAKVEQAVSEQADAQLQLSFTQIRAPFDGIINTIPQKAGSLIEDGTLLTTLSNNKEVFAYFNLSEKEYLNLITTKKLSSEQQVKLILANNLEHISTGKIETIAGEFDNETGSISVRARFENPGLVLKHGSTGKVQIRMMVKNALIVPQCASFEIQHNTCVYILDSSNRVSMKRFIPSVTLPNAFIVESGISNGDRIVYQGIQLVKEGDIIVPEVVAEKEMVAETLGE